MQDLSRRGALRLLGASLGAAALGSTVFSEAASAAAPPVQVALDKPVYVPGDVMTLSVTEELPRPRSTSVVDGSGRSWTKVYDDGARQRWQTPVGSAGDGTVTVTMRTLSGTVTFSASVAYRVLTRSALIGMSAPSGVWHERVLEVGAGLSARRIFADLRQGPDDQIALVEQAHAAGLMPVVSYKAGDDGAGAAAGAYNAVAEKAAARLESYGLPTTVTFWHEPHGDLSPEQFVAGNKQVLPAFKRGAIKVGPLLNGWLLDNQVSTFASFCPDELFGLWDWFGIDSYESGTMEQPGAIKPADRVPALAAYVASRGFTHPLGIGEYNGYSAESITAAGNAILSEPAVWFGCFWNSTEGKGYTLSGDRLAAFRKTLADPRAAAQPTPSHQALDA